MRASQETSGGSSGWPAEGGPDGDVEAVARVAARVASGRGGVGHGDGDLPAVAEPGDGFGHGEVVAVVVDVADHDRGAVHDAVPPDRGLAGRWAGVGGGAGVLLEVDFDRLPAVVGQLLGDGDER